MNRLLVLGMMWIVGVVNGQVSSDDLIIYYPFSGNTNDHSGNDFHAENHGAVLTKDRFLQDGQAYKFDGENDFISIDPIDQLKVVHDFTVVTWVKIENWDENLSTVSNERQYVFDGFSGTYEGVDFTNGPYMTCDLDKNDVERAILGIRKPPTNASSSVEEDLLNNWFQYVVVREGERVYTYLNAHLVQEIFEGAEQLDLAKPLFLGTFSGNNPDYRPELNYNFDGVIDDFRLYKRALSLEEIRALYYGNPCEDLIAKDTVIVQDTLVIEDTVVVQDTIYTELFDTLDVYDTVSVSIMDTVIVTLTDTVVDTFHILSTINDSLIINIKVKKEEEETEARIIAYPNPTYDVMKIEFINPEQLPDYILRVNDGAGKMLYEGHFETHLIEIDISDRLSRGVYYLEVLDPEGNRLTLKRVVLY